MFEALCAAVLIGAASYRIWALIALDTITKPARLWLFNEVRHERKLFKWLRLWLLCPWCAGSWIVAAVTVSVVIFAAGGIAAPVLAGVAAAALTALLGGNDDRLMTEQDEVDFDSDGLSAE